MYCGKCGARNDDGAAFCSVCGAPLRRPEADEGGSKRNRLIGVCAVAIAAAVAVAAVIAVVLLVTRDGCGSRQALAKAYIKAVMDEDFDDVLDLMPDKLFRAYAGFEGMTVKQAREALEEDMDSFADRFGDDMEDARVTSVTVESADWFSDAELASLKAIFRDRFGVKLDLNGAGELYITVGYKLRGMNGSYSCTIHTVKVGSRWYLLDPDSVEDTVRAFYNSY